MSEVEMDATALEFKTEGAALELEMDATALKLETDAVGTLQTGYPYVQALSQDKGQGMHQCAAMCLIASEHASLLREGSGIATCPKAPDPASSFMMALVLPRVLRLWTPPHHQGGLRHYHATLGIGPSLSA
jgi:hypothetical protein